MFMDMPSSETTFGIFGVHVITKCFDFNYKGQKIDYSLIPSLENIP